MFKCPRTFFKSHFVPSLQTTIQARFHRCILPLTQTQVKHQGRILQRRCCESVLVWSPGKVGTTRSSHYKDTHVPLQPRSNLWGDPFHCVNTLNQKLYPRRQKCLINSNQAFQSNFQFTGNTRQRNKLKNNQEKPAISARNVKTEQRREGAWHYKTLETTER